MKQQNPTNSTQLFGCLEQRTSLWPESLFHVRRAPIQPTDMSKAELQRLEKESERFTIEIKQKETENVRLREEIDTIRTKIAESRKTLDDISQGRQSDNNQQLKMKQIMSQRKLSNKNKIREKEISELRSQLKKLRMKTFPSFGTTT